jgi:hypothetical protein
MALYRLNFCTFGAKYLTNHTFLKESESAVYVGNGKLHPPGRPLQDLGNHASVESLSLEVPHPRLQVLNRVLKEKGRLRENVSQLSGLDAAIHVEADLGRNVLLKVVGEHDRPQSRVLPPRDVDAEVDQRL